MRTESSYMFNLIPTPAPSVMLLARIHGYGDAVLTTTLAASAPPLT